MSLPEVESSRTSLASRTDFEVLGLGLGLETSSPRKLACPRLKDSTIFWNVKILWSAWKIFWKTFFSGDRLKNFCEDLFFFFFWRALALCVLGPWPWPRAFLSLASRVSVLGKAVLGLGLGLGFFWCPWPWPRALCPRLHLWSLLLNSKSTKTAFINRHNSYVIYECIFIYCAVSNLRNELELGLPVLHNHTLQQYLKWIFLEFRPHLSFNRLDQHSENFFFNYATTTILNNFNKNL